MTEREIVRQARQGDKESVQWLWNKYEGTREKAAHALIRMAHDPQLHDDFVQEAFEALHWCIHHARLEQADDRWELGLTYSFRLKAVRNRFVTRYKRQASVELMNTDYDDVFAETLSEEAAEESSGFNLGFTLSADRERTFNRYSRTEHDYAELLEREEQFYDSLTDEQRLMIDMRRSGETFAAIANRLERSYSYVQVRMAKLREKAAAIFEVNYAS